MAPAEHRNTTASVQLKLSADEFAALSAVRHRAEVATGRTHSLVECLRSVIRGGLSLPTDGTPAPVQKSPRGRKKKRGEECQST